MSDVIPHSPNGKPMKLLIDRVLDNLADYLAQNGEDPTLAQIYRDVALLKACARNGQSVDNVWFDQ